MSSKYATFLANKLHLLSRRKNKEYLKLTFSLLQSNRIHFYTTKKQQNNKMRQLLKNKAASIMGLISNKLGRNKLKTYFTDLRAKATLKAKANTFKATHLYNRLTAIYRDKLFQTLQKIGAYGKKKVINLRKLSRIQKLLKIKNKNNTIKAFFKLRINAVQLKLKEKEAKTTQITKPNAKNIPPHVVEPVQPVVNTKQLQIQIRKLQTQQKQLLQKKKTLEKQYSKFQNDSERMINQFKRQIERLQNENEELGFNNGLLEENNQELQKEFQNREKSKRKKIPKAEIWQNIYNNLIYFLTINKNKEITKADLLGALEIPLVPCNINLEELNDENKILTELLQEYKKNFPPPQNIPEESPQLIPFDILRKQNRYYYMVLQVLSEWGINGSKQLDQLNNDLTNLQKKLTS